VGPAVGRIGRRGRFPLTRSIGRGTAEGEDSVSARQGVAVGIDLGTTNTVAVLRSADGRRRPILFDGASLMPSAVYLDPAGYLIAGRDAERLAVVDPSRFEPNPKRRIDEAAILLGDREVPVPDLLAAVLRRVATATHEACPFLPPAVLTYPASWGQRRRALLHQAAMAAGWPEVSLVPEPVAAAQYFIGVLRNRVPPGRALVVFDLGAGTLDVAVVRHEHNAFQVIGSGGREDLGGLDIDSALVDHLGTVLARTNPELWTRLQHPTGGRDRRDRWLFWVDVRGAKEMLSRTAMAPVPVPGAESALHVTREELEHAVRPMLQSAAVLTLEVIRSSGILLKDLSGVLLVGGSSRVPLMGRLLHTELGIPPTVLEQPELPVAEGAIIDPFQPAGDAADEPSFALPPYVTPVLPEPVAPTSGAPAAHAAPVAPVSGGPGTQISGVPVSAVPVSALPVSPPYAGPVTPTYPGPVTPPYAGPVAPATTAPLPSAPVSGAPVSGAPAPTAPVSGAPVSGAPVSGAPVSGAPVAARATAAVPPPAPPAPVPSAPPFPAQPTPPVRPAPPEERPARPRGGWSRRVVVAASVAAVLAVLVGTGTAWALISNRHRASADGPASGSSTGAGHTAGLGAASAAAKSGPWKAVPPLPVKLEGAAVAAYKGKLWVAGGLLLPNGSDRPKSTATYIYDPSAKTWSTGPVLPRPISHAAMVATGNGLYFMGGWIATGGSDQLLRLDENADKWVPDKSMPATRVGGAAAWDGTRIVYAGGTRNDQSPGDEVWAFQDSKWTLVGHLKQGRQKLAATSDGAGKVWVLSGGDQVTHNKWGYVEIVSGDQIVEESSLTAPAVDGGIAIRLNGATCELGGRGVGQGPYSGWWCDQAGVADSLPKLDPPRAGLGIGLIDNTVYVVGGYGSSFDGTDRVEAFALAASG
jgi:actin-like ATPase involved in cell morphogenesis